jgi:hypothetical protein
MKEQHIIPPNPPSHRRPLSAQDWEEKRAVIQTLYSTEGMSLSQVMEVLEQNYGFRATYVCASI